MISSLLFLALGGLEALIIRIQLIRPLNDFISPQVFNRMFTMHGTTMIFFAVMPLLLGIANYLVPLMIGARDMAFPRLNAFSFWLSFLGGVLLYFSFLGEVASAAQEMRPTLAGGPTHHRQRVHSPPAIARITGHWLFWFLDSAQSEPESI